MAFFYVVDILCFVSGENLSLPPHGLNICCYCYWRVAGTCRILSMASLIMFCDTFLPIPVLFIDVSYCQLFLFFFFNSLNSCSIHPFINRVKLATPALSLGKPFPVYVFVYLWWVYTLLQWKASLGHLVVSPAGTPSHRRPPLTPHFERYT